MATYDVHDDNGDYTEEWHCQPPAIGVAYMVTSCTWSPDHTVRKIYAVDISRGRETRSARTGRGDHG